MVSITPEIQDLLNRKLYHQFTEACFDLFQSPENAKNAQLFDFFKAFVAPVGQHLNPVKFTNLLRLAIEGLQYSDAMAALELYKKRMEDNEESNILYICIKGRLLAANGENIESYETLNIAKNKLKDILGVDLSVRGAYHLALAHLARFREHWAEVYTEGMLYLAYTSLNSIQHSDVLDVAELISVASLAASRVVDVQEFAHHACVSTLKEDPGRGWLGELVEAFSSGQISVFESAFNKHQARLSSHPVLAKLEKQLREKITLLALVDLAFSQPSKERSLSFDQISHHCRIPLDQVEQFVLRAVARGLAKASIDQVALSVRFHWVKPQMLNNQQINALKSRLFEWAESAEKLVGQVGDMAPEITASALISSIKV